MWPLVGLAPDHPLVRGAAELVAHGCAHTRKAGRPVGEGEGPPPDPADAHAAEALRVAAVRCLAGGGAGLAVPPVRGRLVLFFSRQDDGSVDHRSWHGGADVLAPEGKWTLQLFKEYPEGTADVAAYVRERRAALRAMAAQQQAGEVVGG